MEADALLSLFMDALTSHRLISFITYLISIGFLVEGLFATKRISEFFLSDKKAILSNKIAKISRLSRTKTGYVGAFLAKYTLTVTILILMISIALNALSALRMKENSSSIEHMLLFGCISFIAMNVLLVFSIVAFVLLVCRKIVKDVEAGVDAR